VNPYFSKALAASHEALQNQDFPMSSLYMVATPIGNLADITLRALHTLAICDFIACEDTRLGKVLLQSYGIEKKSTAWIALHQHNEADQAPHIINHLKQGSRVAYICDAGTPGISDPGAYLVKNVAVEGLRIVPIPGVSSVTTLISSSGHTGHSGFAFLGFAPSKANERQLFFDSVASDNRALIILEAPHRIESLASSLLFLNARPITVGRELTKQFEEICTFPASHFTQWIKANANRTRGEFAVLIHAVPNHSSDNKAALEELLGTLLEELSVKSAVKLAQSLTKTPKNELYAMALKLSQDT
jgi:16S rRNA (cytidine1402-2'-O)-methyltransferase